MTYKWIGGIKTRRYRNSQNLNNSQAMNSEEYRQYLHMLNARYGRPSDAGKLSRYSPTRFSLSASSRSASTEKAVSLKSHLLKKAITTIVLVFVLLLSSAARIIDLITNSVVVQNNAFLWTLGVLIALLSLEIQTRLREVYLALVQVLMLLDVVAMAINDRKGWLNHKWAEVLNDVAVGLVFLVAFFASCVIAFRNSYESVHCTNSNTGRSTPIPNANINTNSTL